MEQKVCCTYRGSLTLNGVEGGRSRKLGQSEENYWRERVVRWTGSWHTAGTQLAKAKNLAVGTAQWGEQVEKVCRGSRAMLTQWHGNSETQR